MAFSKSPTYNGQPDKMIVDRKEFLMLLDRLNRGIYDMMEQYEQTRQSRQNAERSFRRKGNEIIEKANASADDIYAASVIYTADAIGRIRDLMDQTNESMNDLFRQFRRELREQKDTLRSHESELQAQLADLADTKKYLDLLQDVNRERERKNRDLEAEWEAGNQYARATFRTAAPAAHVRVDEEYFEKPGAAKPEAVMTEPAAPTEQPDIVVNKDAAYFKWKEEQEKQKEQKSNEPATDDDAIAEAEGTGSDREADESEIPVQSASAVAEDELTEAVSDTDIMVEGDPAPEETRDPAFPDEAAIYQAVLEDERAAEAERYESEKRERPHAAGILKTIIFGKD
ncbi:MAG: hypothetical protein LIO39_02880 [Lachnospiraceae bacterium]|nr:hypothetical protein [Lachnospiraceae bacterium]